MKNVLDNVYNNVSVNVGANVKVTKPTSSQIDKAFDLL